MNESYLNSEKNTALSSKPSTAIRLLLMILFVSITPLVSFGQSCNVVKTGDFTGSINTTNWSVQTETTGWYYSTWAPNEAYVDADGVTDVSLKQSVTGLIGSSLTLSFKIKGQNAGRSSVCPTTGLLVVKVGGKTYMTISNPGNNSQITVSNITVSNGATYTTTGFPITVAGASPAAITQGIITITIPWTTDTAGDLEFLATTSKTTDGSCTAWGGDDWFLDDISLIASNPTSFAMTGASVCAGNNTTVGLNGSQLGVNYQLQIGGVNTGSVIAGTGFPISFGNQSTTGIYTVVATAGTTSCTTAMSGSVSISPNLSASLSIAASPAGTICYGTSVTFTAIPTNGGTTPVYQWKLNGTNVGTNSLTYTNATLVNSDVVTCVMTSNATPCLTVISATSNAVTIATTGPTATGATICAGGTGTLTSSYVCADSAPVALTKFPTAATNGTGITWTNPTSVYSDNDGSYATLALNRSTSATISATGYDFSAIPNNATITNVEVVIGRLANKNGVRDNALNLIVSGVSGGTNMADTSTDWTTAEVAKSYLDTPSNWGYPSLTIAQIKASNFGVAFSARELNGSRRNLSIDYISVLITYTVPGSLDWYTASSGGTKIGSGSSFNPVGVAGGLVNTNTAGTTTYYAECSTNAGCRTPVNFVINALPSTPTIGTITQPDCVTATGSVVLSGLPASGTINQTGTVVASYPITGTTMTISGLVAAGTYSFSASNGTCSSLTTGNVAINSAVAKTWNGTTWSPSLAPPTKNDVVIINGDYNTSSNGDLNACSLTINAGYKLTITPLQFVVVQNDLTVNGTLDVLDKGSLVMVNDAGKVSGTGKTMVHKFTTATKKFDFVYWSTPVASTTIASTFLGWRTDRAYEYDNGWKYATAMTPAKGYIITVPNSGGAVSADFEGQVNNGVKKIANIAPSAPYLVGNPYPSAINADAFLNENAGAIEGTIYFWTHNTAIQLASNIKNGTAGSGAYAFTSDDYATYNIVGGVATGPGGGSLPNSGGSLLKPKGEIASCQGFFVSSNAANKLTSNEIVFKNAMRLGSGSTALDNTNFFRTKAPKTAKTFDKNRLWLNLTNTGGAFKQLLVGYVTDATNDYDSRFDGESFAGNQFIDFYSVVKDKNLTIQGRALPFDEKDEVALGYNTAIDGDFTISIDEVDGFMTGKSVFLEDKLTNTVFDLKAGNYTFNTAKGTFNDRFVLKYANKTLGVEDVVEKEDGILALYASNYQTLIIHNKGISSIVNSVALFNMAGQKIGVWNVKDLEQTNILIPIKDISSGIYIVKISTTNGDSSKKIVVN